MKSLKNKILIVFGLIVGFFSCTNTTKEYHLPIIGEKDVHYTTVNGKEVADTTYHVVPDFEYINQDSVMIASKDLRNKVWVADFFFTSCPSICPSMTTNMKRLSENTTDLKNHVQFLSFSIDPYKDQPTRLRAYIKERNLDDSNWSFFVGDEEATHNLAREFFNAAEKNDSIPGGFGHTPYFSIVDTKGHIRGIYDGTNAKAVDSLERDLRMLLTTEYNVTTKRK
ncbi:MAG: SCO family protein [Crocinitomicaceae bacterium]|nr:SCO family protein [Crocinitomicaceae bacterium]